MYRTTVLQKIIHTLKAESYLEIGVHAGRTFSAIKARKKVAVDPDFQIPPRRKLWNWLSQGWKGRITYYEMTSDDFFATRSHSHGEFDVIFIDGLHTYQQSLQDVLHSLNILSPRGVIVMHDCFPPHAAAAHPANSLEHAISLNLPGWTREWCGDTWKTICKLRSSRSDLNVFVLNCDYGLGIITRGTTNQLLSYDDRAIESLTYDEMKPQAESVLNLKEPEYLKEFLGQYQMK